MSKHPYPKHVIKAAAKALLKSSETRNTFGAGGDWEAAGHTIQQEFLDHANTALQALWDASRVDTPDALEIFADKHWDPKIALVDARGTTWPLEDYELIPSDGYPAHVIF